MFPDKEGLFIPSIIGSAKFLFTQHFEVKSSFKNFIHNHFYNPVFLLGKGYGQRSLVDYSPWGCRLDMTDHTCTHTVLEESLLCPHFPFGETETAGQ